jgi:hypothetical protein
MLESLSGQGPSVAYRTIDNDRSGRVGRDVSYSSFQGSPTDVSGSIDVAANKLFRFPNIDYERQRFSARQLVRRNFANRVRWIVAGTGEWRIVGAHEMRRKWSKIQRSVEGWELFPLIE